MSLLQFTVPAKGKNPFTHELPRLAKEDTGPVDFCYKGLPLDEVRRQGGLEKAKEIYTAAVTIGRGNEKTIDSVGKVNFEYRFKAKSEPRRISLDITRSDGEVGEIAFEEYPGNESIIPEEYFNRFVRINVNDFIDKWEDQ